MWDNEVDREGMDGEFDKAESGFNDFAVGRGDEDEDCGENLGEHVLGDVICVFGTGLMKSA